MSKCITIDDETYQMLRSLKQGPGDSFTKVIRRNVHKPLETCGEVLDAYEQDPPPQKAELSRLDRIERERGRRSGGRK
jgi:predicted CopG family antitoxin